MSHEGTNWAVQQRGLKPATKLVLWYLCDRHNPDYGCFPSQERLAEDAEMSRSTLNLHLQALEAAGLIRREARIDKQSGRQLNTRYTLAFEKGFEPRAASEEADAVNPPLPLPDGERGADVDFPCPETGHGAPEPVSEKCADPCPENGKVRVRNSDTNPVREPLREPVKEEEGAGAREAFELFFSELLRVLGHDPEMGLPAWWQGWPARDHVKGWMREYGFGEERILEIAAASRRDNPDPPDGPKALDAVMLRVHRRRIERAETFSAERRQKGGKVAAAPVALDRSALEFYAGLVNGAGYMAPSTIHNSLRDRLLEAGLVTRERLRERGVR
jgi:DNA-binding MarR family transcriptional regulator